VGRAVVTTVPSRAERAVARMSARIMRGLLTATERVCEVAGSAIFSDAVSAVPVLNIFPEGRYCCSIDAFGIF
jgi:hypothetical protein